MARRLGVALGGGGLRGLAHIGVLKALDNAGLPVEAVAGTSMGGLVGAAYAAGWAPTDLEKQLAELKSLTRVMRLIDWWPGRRALISGQGILDYFTELLGEARLFADLRIPFACTAVNLEDGEEVVLDSGRLKDALNCTMALPGIFDPVNLHGQLLVDGGLRNNVPADVARSLGADVVLAVDVSLAGLVGRRDDPSVATRWTIASDLWRSQVILMRAVTEHKLQEAAPEALIRPALPEGISAFSGISRLQEIVDSGERAAAAAVPRLRAALAGVSPYTESKLEEVEHEQPPQ